MNSEIKIYQQNNQLVTDTNTMAEVFHKRHNNVLRDVINLKEELSDEKDLLNFEQMFQPTEYIDNYGRKQPGYIMNRDGFSLLAMGFTGPKALHWKMKYIEAFNKMEAELKRRSTKSIKTYLGKPVVTLADIDEYHNLEKGSAAHSAFMAKNTMIPNYDYFTIDSNEYINCYGSSYSNHEAKSIGLLTESGYREVARPFADAKTQMDFITCHFRLYVEQPSVTAELPKKDETRLIIPTKKDRDAIDMAFCAYAAVYNYYVKNTTSKLSYHQLIEQDGFKWIKGTGTLILSNAEYFGRRGGRQIKPDETPIIRFATTGPTDTSIRIPRIGRFEFEDHLNAGATQATITRDKHNNYYAKLKLRS